MSHRIILTIYEKLKKETNTLLSFETLREALLSKSNIKLKRHTYNLKALNKKNLL